MTAPESKAALAELLESADDYLNGEDPAAWCDDSSVVVEVRDAHSAARLERLRAAIAKATGAAP